MTMRIASLVILSCMALGACTNGAAPSAANSPALSSVGDTASNGGGQRALGNIPSVGTTSGGSTITSVPNTKGPAY